MDVIIEERGKQFVQDLHSKSRDIERLLHDETDEQRKDWLRILVRSLLTYSHSHVLLRLPVNDLLDWLQECLDFLHLRTETVSIRLYHPPNHDRSYLLINTSDVPYLVDSLKMLFQGVGQYATIIAHPILTTERVEGRLTKLGRDDGAKESFVLVEVERELSDIDGLFEQIRNVLGAAQSTGSQQGLLKEHLDRIVELASTREQQDFFDWIKKGNFICFGAAVLHLQADEGSGLSVKGESRCGWMPTGVLPDSDLAQSAGDDGERLSRSNQLLVEVLDQLSLLHRSEPLVYLGLREELESGAWREHLLVGLFSQQSLNELTVNVPPLKAKVLAAMERQNILRNSYDFRKTLEIFNAFPKVELFFLNDVEMDDLVRSFVALQRQHAVKVMVTRSLSLRGVTLLMIMPREFYGSDAIPRLEAYLSRYLKAEHIDSQIMHFYSEYLSLHFRVVPRVSRLKIDVDALEKRLTELVRPWDERLRLLLDRSHGSREGMRLWKKFSPAFTPEYKALNHPRFAIRDVAAIEQLLSQGVEHFDLWGPFRERKEYFRLQFYSLEESCLNALMPYLENLSLTVVDEVDFKVEVDERTVYIKSFAIRNEHQYARPLHEQRQQLLDVLHGLWQGRIEDDYLNRLLVLTGLDWKQIDVFRAYRNYYFQLGNPFTKRRVAFTMINNPQVALLLYRYFEARFRPDTDWEDPLQREEEALMPVRMELAEVLNTVTDINEDRILRSLFNLIDSTVRTNFFFRRDDPDYFLSFKISAIGIIDMPFPRPLYETYVHSATMEGIHLRGGMVARGGIRWSDRPDDFRTEVLGLMKTQMTKNSLIVPVGSKGGFIVKTPFETREEGAELSRQAYITLMRGLLDLVDNRVGDRIEHPDGVVIYDDVDPYLVVAADKGTAHLPDTANAVSADYGFWLGDAFASGGSQGYDHKQLGITARGAWECVKRHFRELGKDIQNEDFTAVGIGDMSGDVFGNGMLLSRHTRLLAAFDHRHIFVDPDPDAAASWLERKRLFELPRSTWADYQPDLISKGGGVWSRSAKDIPLSPEIRDWLGLRHTSIDGETLIRRLLTAAAELLWNGGVGTYVKSSYEKNADVGDRSNDAVRVNANQIQARVVGEGGNLGFTQKARIEYALTGGLINTDAIDNSAGVDTSDHEVNLKIFYQNLLDSGKVKTEGTRNRQMTEMQDAVCEKVLHNNYMQSLCISLDLLRSQSDAEPYFDLADRLANAGLLDREGEELPSRKGLATRGQGYVRPELAILLGYSKMHLYQALLESDLPDQESVQSLLQDYFPLQLQKRYRQQLLEHPLQREIVATMITNQVVDQAGCAFINSLMRQAGSSAEQTTAAYLVFDRVLNGDEIRAQVFSADNCQSTEQLYSLLNDFEKTLAELCNQALDQNLPVSLDQSCVREYADRLTTFLAHLDKLLPVDEWQLCKETADRLAVEGFPENLALQMASLRYIAGFLPAVYIANETGSDLIAVTGIMSDLRQRLKVPVVIDSLNDYLAHDRWDRMAQNSLRSSYVSQVVRLTHQVVTEGVSVSSYLAAKRQRYDYYHTLVEALQSQSPTSMSPYMVLLRALEALG
jgi:glutamate dehydrogenase